MLTDAETEIYDRQIRLWGVNAQNRIRRSKVLMLGFNGIASEVAKILVLAGIDTLTIVDDEPLSESDRWSNLFCRPNNENHIYRTHSVETKLKRLNPLVKVEIQNRSVQSLKLDDFKTYDLSTLHVLMDTKQIMTIDDYCRKSDVKFYLALDFGFFGFMFNNLGPNFKFSLEEYERKTIEDNDTDVLDAEEDDEVEEGRPKKRRRLDSIQKDLNVGNDSSLPYVSFESLISSKPSKRSSPVFSLTLALLKFFDCNKRMPEQNPEDMAKIIELFGLMNRSHEGPILKDLDPDWIDNIYGSLSPVCSVVGGVAGQDMVRVLSAKGTPICNTFAFDGLRMSGYVDKIGLVVDAKPIVRDTLQID